METLLFRGAIGDIWEPLMAIRGGKACTKRYLKGLERHMIGL